MTIILRPRQHQALDDLRHAYATGARAPILVAPTGFGKTATATEIVRQSIARGKRVWFLAHLREILHDTSTRLTAAGIRHGHIQAGRSADYSLPVQVVAIATAARRAHLPRPDLIIVDECHLAVARSYREVIAAVGRPRLLGLTGTPQRLDGRGLGEVFDRLVLTCGTAELVDEALLAPVRVFAPPGADLTGLHKRGGDFDQSEASDILSRPAVVGDALSHWLKLCQGRRGVAFCTGVPHAQAVAEQWRRAGFRALAVHGGSDNAERREAIEGLRAGRLDLVACAQLWVAGVDVPEIDAVIWLRPTQSLTVWLQGNGRGLRIAPGKRDLLILDHVGNVGRLGHPLDPREWSLEGRAKRDREAAPSVKVCPACFSAISSQAQTCPECQHRFAPERRELEHVEGELQEMRRGAPEEGFSVGDIVYNKSSKKLFEIINERQVFWNTDNLGYYRVRRFNSHIVTSIDEVRLRYATNDEIRKEMESHSQRLEQGKAQTLSDLVALGKARGLRNPHGWARHVLAAREARGQRVPA